MEDCIYQEAHQTFHWTGVRSWPFGAPGVLEPAKKGRTVLEGPIDPDYQGRLGPLLYHGGKEEHVCGARDPSGRIQASWKLQLSSPDMKTAGPDPLRESMILPTQKLTEALAESGGGTERAVADDQ